MGEKFVNICEGVRLLNKKLLNGIKNASNQPT